MNATNLAAFRARARAVNEAVFPATVKIGTKGTVAAAAAVAASTSGVKRMDKLTEIGFLPEDAVVFRVTKTLLGARPTVGQYLTWVEENLTFRIAAVETGGAKTAFYKLDCGAVTK